MDSSFSILNEIQIIGKSFLNYFPSRSLLGRGLLQLVVGVEVVLAQSRQLSLQHEGRLVHLGPVHLALDQPVRQGVGLALQLVNLLPQQSVLVLKTL